MERRKKGRVALAAEGQERELQALSRAVLWPQKPARQVLSCTNQNSVIQKSGFIPATPDAFFTHEAQSEATGNTSGINRR